MLSYALAVCFPFHIFSKSVSDICVYTVLLKSLKGEVKVTCDPHHQPYSLLPV